MDEVWKNLLIVLWMKVFILSPEKQDHSKTTDTEPCKDYPKSMIQMVKKLVSQLEWILELALGSMVLVHAG
jgi:hypothetical protein